MWEEDRVRSRRRTSPSRDVVSYVTLLSEAKRLCQYEEPDEVKEITANGAAQSPVRSTAVVYRKRKTSLQQSGIGSFLPAGPHLRSIQSLQGEGK